MRCWVYIIPVTVTLLLLLPAKFVFGQEIERKIIIKNKTCYYTTIGEESQLATLHAASVQEPFGKAKTLTLPAGRNDNDPIIPFCWDLDNKNMFAVNFITNAMNSRNKALKLFPVASLNEQHEGDLMHFLLYSFELNTLTDFQPLEFVTTRSKVLEHFFFDGVMLGDSSLCMVISNKDELTVWFYKNGSWEHSPIHQETIESYFSLFTHKSTTYLISGNGKIYSVSPSGILELPDKKLSFHLQDILLIINKDNDTVQILERKKLNNSLPFNELVQKNALPLF